MVKEKGMSPEQIDKHLKDLSVKGKIKYLNQIYERTKGFSSTYFANSTAQNLWRKLGELYSKTGDYPNAADCYEKLGSPGDAAKFYEMAAQVEASGGRENNSLMASAERNYKAYAIELEEKGDAVKAKRIWDKIHSFGARQAAPIRLRLGGLVSKLASVIGILAGIFFLSPNLTGNAISNLTNSTSSFIGAGLIIIGLIAGLFWMKSRKK